MEQTIPSPASQERRLYRLGMYEHLWVCMIARSVCSHRVVALLQAASRYGDRGLSITVFALLLAAGRVRVALAWLAATLVALVLQCSMKRFFQRVRPCMRPDGPPQRAPIPDKGSFPSGHTLHAALAFVVIMHVLPAAAPIFFILATLIAVSRVALGVHYPSDVAAGACLGALLGSLVTIIG